MVYNLFKTSFYKLFFSVFLQNVSCDIGSSEPLGTWQSALNYNELRRPYHSFVGSLWRSSREASDFLWETVLTLYKMYNLLHFVGILRLYVTLSTLRILSYVSFDHDSKIWTGRKYYLGLYCGGDRISDCDPSQGHRANNPGLGQDNEYWNPTSGF